MNYVACIPYAHQPYFDEFISRSKIPPLNMLAIDNTANNIGIMKAHNLGVNLMEEQGADWLIIMSAAIRFGEPGGLDFIDQLAQHPEYDIVQGEQMNAKQVGNKVFGWHLMAFKREVLSNVGSWDENFSPYGFDDIDLSLRIQKYYRGKKLMWGGLPCDVADTTMSHSINLAGVKAGSGPRAAYFLRKWGRAHGDYQSDGYEHPFNDPTKPLSYWPQPDDPLSIYQNEYKIDGWNYED